MLRFRAYGVAKQKSTYRKINIYWLGIKKGANDTGGREGMPPLWINCTVILLNTQVPRLHILTTNLQDQRAGCSLCMPSVLRVTGERV